MTARDESTIRPGQTIGAWTTVSRIQRSGRTAWDCRCICGVTRIVDGASLKDGRSTSCGCQLVKYRGGTRGRHGHSRDPIYKVWTSMHQRCNNPNSQMWERYGARGIKVVPRWNDFETFAADMGPRPVGYSIERMDNDGPYSPDNCRWASHKEQNRNFSRNSRFEYGGEMKTISELAEISGIHKATLRVRLNKGMPVEDALARVPVYVKRNR